MLEYKIILGASASVINIIGYIPYFRDIARGKTKPHIFSWLVWGILTGIAFFAQVSKGAGPGAWVTGISALFCTIIAIVAFFRGEKDITALDWFYFASALIGLLLWELTANPLFAILLITLIDIFAFVPTFRKAYNKPQEETLSLYTLSALKFAVGLAALQAYNLTTWLYPASLVITNGLFAVMLTVRRHTLTSTKNHETLDRKI
ncbi:MAG: hypothetical protein WAP52_03200 [Candidatus Sungiibacteriota bacterium]